jgi:hypothetical protein
MSAVKRGVKRPMSQPTRPKSTNESALEEIRRNHYFDEHQITREHYGQWYCGKPGTGIFHFRVVMVPGSIILTGDLGEMILNVYSHRPLRWARGARFRPTEPYYPMSKLSHSCRAEEFLPDEATAYLMERIQEARVDGDRKQVKRYIKMTRAWKEVDKFDHREAEREWYQLCYDHGYDDPPGFRDHTINAYFRFQALCWFMSHVNPEDSRFKEELKP